MHTMNGDKHYTLKEFYEKYHVRRYGFHGASHRYVSKRVCEILGLDQNNSKIITCHIGNGGSVACLLYTSRCV